MAEQLHQAREARKMTIQQVAEITKIRADHVRALEQGDFQVFSAPVYIRGFVRTYSTLLKLDVPNIMAALDAELGQTPKFSEPPSLSGQPRGALDFLMLLFSSMDLRKGLIGVGILFSLAVICGSVLVWRHYRYSDPLRGLKPGLYQSTQGVPGETLPLPPPRRPGT